MPAVPAGRQVRLNFRTPMAGEIRGGIQGVEGRSIQDCDPLAGDWLDRTVTWAWTIRPWHPGGPAGGAACEDALPTLFSVAFV